MELTIRTLIAGLAFGAWPLLMNRSGLSGNFSVIVFGAIMLVCVSPFAFWQVGDLSSVIWKMAIAASVVGAVGMMSFNGMLAKATPQQVGSLFVVMIMIQTAVPAIYSLMMNGGLTIAKSVGFLCAAVAAVLLTL